jgi:2-keto-4-pentenoate hydratase/2-oxohepta-3-ene-1,7-dioic acid hydratase in catechol pathway
MKLSLFEDHRVGVWGRDDTVVDVTSLIDPCARPMDRMNRLIEDWDDLAPALIPAQAAVGTPLSQVRLRAPQPRPTKIVAAPVNHASHQREMALAGAFSGPPRTIETYVAFLKAPSSIVGSGAAIELPHPDRRVDYEGELGIIIGRRARHVSRADALDYVFGYVPLLDITMRGDEDRSYRKSFDTFTPLGPAIVTADEIASPDALEIEVTINGTTRQRGDVQDFIYDVGRLIEAYSEAMTLEPGDIVASGTPDGVGPLLSGDEVTLTIAPLPPLTMTVRPRDRAPTELLREPA